MATSDTPRVYVACLAAYNNGVLHGAWLDATDPDELSEGVAAMLKASPIPLAEEWAIHDYENFAGIKVGEYDSLQRVAAIGAAIEESDDPDAFGAWVSMDASVLDDLDSLAENFREAYVGEYDSDQDFAMQYSTDVMGEDGVVTALGSVESLPECVSAYLDWEAIGRDLLINNFYSTKAPSYGIYVFHQ